MAMENTVERDQPESVPTTFVQAFDDNDREARSTDGPEVIDADYVDLDDRSSNKRGPVSRMISRLREFQRRHGIGHPVAYTNDELRTAEDAFDRIEEVRRTLHGHRYYMTDLGAVVTGRRGIGIEQDSAYARELLLYAIQQQDWQAVVILGGDRRYQRELAQFLQRHGIQARLAKDTSKPSPRASAGAPSASQSEPEAVDADLEQPAGDGGTETARQRPGELPSP